MARFGSKPDHPPTPVKRTTSWLSAAASAVSSAAHFYRKAAGKRARILILDNHDDFGGHAKRNEFQQTGRMLLGYGGTFSIESPAPYSAVAKELVRELGIDVEKLQPAIDRKLYRSLGLHPAIFFDKETFGADRLVPIRDVSLDGEAGESAAAADPWKEFMESAPLSEAARRDIRAIYETKTDYFPGLSSADKKAKLARISYARFLTEVAGLDPQVVAYFQARPHPLVRTRHRRRFRPGRVGTRFAGL